MEQALIWVVGAIGAPLIQFFKNKFGLSGKPAQIFAGVVAVLLAVGVMFYQGEVELADFNWANFFVVGGQILASAQLVYRLLMK
jgi:hypothetical protein